MVTKWVLAIQIWCHPNPGHAQTRFVLHNEALSQVYQNSRELPGITKNNEAYYHALIKGLTTTRSYGARYIVTYKNSELIINQMNGTYQVRRPNLKPLHQQARSIAAQFHRFEIMYKCDVQRVCDSILIEAASNGRGCGRFVDPTCAPPIIIDRHRYRWSINEWIVVLIVIGVVMG